MLRSLLRSAAPAPPRVRRGVITLDSSSMVLPQQGFAVPHRSNASLFSTSTSPKWGKRKRSSPLSIHLPPCAPPLPDYLRHARSEKFFDPAGHIRFPTCKSHKEAILPNRSLQI